MNKSNVRIAIIKAMVALLEKEKFDQITIKQICAESGVIVQHFMHILKINIS